MNKDQFLNLLQTLLKVIGTALATHGATQAAGLVNSEDMIGLVLALGGIVWSHYFNATPPAGPNNGQKGTSALPAIGLIGLIGLIGSARAQTNTNITLPPPALSLTNSGGVATLIGSVFGSGAQQLAGDVLNLVADEQPYWGTNQSFQLGGGALRSAGQWGGVADLMFPVTPQLRIGIAGAYIGGSWYDASLALNVGMTLGSVTNIPLVGKYIPPPYLWVESGPGFNFHSHTLIAQSASGVTLDIPLGAHWSLGGTYAKVNISDRPGVGDSYWGHFGYRF